MDYENGAWKDARIIPFQNITVNPAFLSLHYGQSVFEGMKAHKGKNGEAVLFRPDEMGRNTFVSIIIGFCFTRVLVVV
jgi:branched-chain amino acid aminotransferase